MEHDAILILVAGLLLATGVAASLAAARVRRSASWCSRASSSESWSRARARTVVQGSTVVALAARLGLTMSDAEAGAQTE